MHCDRISVDDLVGFRIDHQDSGLHAIEDGQELLAIFSQCSLRVVEFGPELGSRAVAGLLEACQCRPFVVDTRPLFAQGLRLLQMAAHCMGSLSEPWPLAPTSAI